MEPPPTATRFRFREPENSADSDSDLSTLSSYKVGDEPDLDSMTGKGISRLCAELVEIKAASDEDFHRTIFANYSAFVGIFEDVSDMKKELVQLKNQVLTQKRIVEDLMDGAYLKLFEREISSMIQESEYGELPQPNELENYIQGVSENLDVLLLENRIDEAIATVKMEEENIQKVQAVEGVRSNFLLYNSVVAEKKAMLTLQLTLVAENGRVSARELQNALAGLCRLGDDHLVTQLLIKYYHSHLASAMHSLQGSKSFNHVVYIRELSKYVFSAISQAVKSFTLLYGETSAYVPELVQWVGEEIETFVAYFTKFIKSISEISGGLSTAVQAAQFAISYCALLEPQRLVLRPSLIKCIRLCMEEVLQMRINHFKKVIGIFTATDDWVLNKYLVSGILNETYSSMVVGQQPDYCLLTGSGRKFITLLQAIGGDVSPLVALQMEGSILSGLVNLFMEYVSMLERAISEKDTANKSGSSIIHAESVAQQVTILVNISTIEQFFSSTFLTTFEGIKSTDLNSTDSHSSSIQQQDLDDCTFLIREASSQLRVRFCQQFIRRMMSFHNGSVPVKGIPLYSGGDSDLVHLMMPSVAFQVFFREVRKLGKLAEENLFTVDWLAELLGELIEAIFFGISKDREIQGMKKNNGTSEHPNGFNQLVLDIYFLVEVARQGEYFSKKPLVLTTLMNSTFISAGLDPGRDIEDEGWAIEAAAGAIERLLEMEQTETLLEAAPSAEELPEISSEHASEDAQEERCSSANSQFSDEDGVATNSTEVSINGNKQLTNDISPSPLRLDAEDRTPFDRTGSHQKVTVGDAEDIESEKAIYDKFHFYQEAGLPGLLLTARTNSTGEEFVLNELEIDEDTELITTETSLDDSINPVGRELIRISPLYLSNV